MYQCIHPPIPSYSWIYSPIHFIQSVNPPVYLSIHPSTTHSIPVLGCVHSSVYPLSPSSPSICSPTCFIQSVNAYTCQIIHQPTHSIHLSIRPYILSCNLNLLEWVILCNTAVSTSAVLLNTCGCSFFERQHFEGSVADIYKLQDWS